jgi:hypothetical protein
MNSIKEIVDRHHKEYKKVFDQMTQKQISDQELIHSLMIKIKDLQIENDHLKRKLDSIHKIVKL